ncbi:DUF2768 domain-containing protein [Psychrobacillus sp. INOP01]|nr:DUF2768 domain-containing protein [Psychrobacillus sp. INOP01]
MCYTFLLKKGVGVVLLVSSMDKMWISFGSMGCMFLAMAFMFFVKNKLNNKFLKFIFGLIAYILLFVGFITMIYIISNPTKA